LPRRALLRGELAEAGEGHCVALLERVGDGVEEGVDRLRRIALGEPAPVRHLVDEVGFRH
jgi:hypothetical protein